MVKFFVPAPEGREVETIRGFRRFMKDQSHPTDGRCFYRLHYRHDGKDWDVKVDEYHGAINEPVIAILFDHTRDVYLILTPNRGVLRGNPIMVGADTVYTVEEFEGAPRKEETE